MSHAANPVSAPLRFGPRAALAAVAGLAYALAQVGFGVWPLVFVCLAAWWSASTGLGPLRAASLGALFGGAAYTLAMAWLAPSIARFAGAGEGAAVVGALLWLLLGAWIAAGFAVVGGAFAWMSGRGLPIAIAGTAPLVLVEWLQPRFFTAGVGESLIHALPFAQLAALGGPLLLTGFVGLANALVLTAWTANRRGDRTRALRASLMLGALVGGVFVAGLARIAALEGDASANDEARLVVGVVQANLGVGAARIDAAPAHKAHLEGSRRLIDGAPVDLLVWPENAYPRAIPRPLPVDAQSIRDDLRAPLLFGANGIVRRAGRRAATNSVFLADADGRIDQAYDKQRLIPFAETEPPGVLATLRARWLPDARSLVAGGEAEALALGPHRIATPICFEITLPGFVRALVRDTEATLLVTVADDGWFGASQEPEMHLALARWRAIEHARWLVRAAGVGPSAVVAPSGRVVARLEPFEAGELRATVRSSRVRTPYASFGDWPALAAGVAVVMGGLFATRRDKLDVMGARDAPAFGDEISQPTRSEG